MSRVIWKISSTRKSVSSKAIISFLIDFTLHAVFYLKIWTLTGTNSCFDRTQIPNKMKAWLSIDKPLWQYVALDKVHSNFPATQVVLQFCWSVACKTFASTQRKKPQMQTNISIYLNDIRYLYTYHQINLRKILLFISSLINVIKRHYSFMLQHKRKRA